MPVAALAIAPIEDDDVAAVIALWQRCGLTRPWNDPAADIALARREPMRPCWSGATATASSPRPWSAMTAIAAGSITSPSIRIVATRVMAASSWRRPKTGCAQRGIAKLQLMVRRDNTKVQAFYESLGYDEQERIIYAKWLDGREPTP